MKSAAQIAIAQVLHTETTFQGHDIDPRTAPVFQALGLGAAGDIPARAMEFLPDMFLAGVIGYYLVCGNADIAIRDSWRIECVPLPTTAAMKIVGTLDRFMFPNADAYCEPDPAIQTVWAIRDKLTMQVIVYLRTVKADAPCDYFTIDPI